MGLGGIVGSASASRHLLVRDACHGIARVERLHLPEHKLIGVRDASHVCLACPRRALGRPFAPPLGRSFGRCAHFDGRLHRCVRLCPAFGHVDAVPPVDMMEDKVLEPAPRARPVGGGGGAVIAEEPHAVAASYVERQARNGALQAVGVVLIG